MRAPIVTPVLLRQLFTGFVAGALAVVAFHQTTSFALGFFSLTRSAPWSLAPMPPFGVPRLLDLTFWGGLWGILFVVVADRFPRALPFPIKGVLFGLLGPVLIGWLIVAPLKHEPMFGGFVGARMLATVLVNGMFGLGLGFIVPGLAWLERVLGTRSLWPARLRVTWFHR